MTHIQFCESCDLIFPIIGEGFCFSPLLILMPPTIKIYIEKMNYNIWTIDGMLYWLILAHILSHAMDLMYSSDLTGVIQFIDEEYPLLSEFHILRPTTARIYQDEKCSYILSIGRIICFQNSFLVNPLEWFIFLVCDVILDDQHLIYLNFYLNILLY